MANYLKSIQLCITTIFHSLHPKLSYTTLYETWKTLLYSVTSTISSLCRRSFSSPVNKREYLRFPGKYIMVLSNVHMLTNMLFYYLLPYSLWESKQECDWVIIWWLLIFSFKRPGLHLLLSQASCAQSAFEKYYSYLQLSLYQSDDILCFII